MHGRCSVRHSKAEGRIRLSVSLKGLTVAVVGGDSRERILIDGLLAAEADVIAVGYQNLPAHPRLRTSRSLLEATAVANAVIAPMSNTDAHGTVRAVPDPTLVLRLDEEFFAKLRPGTPLFIGIAQPRIRTLARQYDIPLIETADSIAFNVF